jgi:hypothetical protein
LAYNNILLPPFYKFERRYVYNGDIWEFVLDYGSECDLVSGQFGCGSRVWDGVSAVVYFWTVDGGELGRCLG